MTEEHDKTEEIKATIETLGSQSTVGPNQSEEQMPTPQPSSQNIPSQPPNALSSYQFDPVIFQQQQMYSQILSQQYDFWRYQSSPMHQMFAPLPTPHLLQNYPHAVPSINPFLVQAPYSSQVMQPQQVSWPHHHHLPLHQQACQQLPQQLPHQYSQQLQPKTQPQQQTQMQSQHSQQSQQSPQQHQQQLQPYAVETYKNNINRISPTTCSIGTNTSFICIYPTSESSTKVHVSVATSTSPILAQSIISAQLDNNKEDISIKSSQTRTEIIRPDPTVLTADLESNLQNNISFEFGSQHQLPEDNGNNFKPLFTFETIPGIDKQDETQLYLKIKTKNPNIMNQELNIDLDALDISGARYTDEGNRFENLSNHKFSESKRSYGPPVNQTEESDLSRITEENTHDLIARLVDNPEKSFIFVEDAPVPALNNEHHIMNTPTQQCLVENISVQQYPVKNESTKQSNNVQYYNHQHGRSEYEKPDVHPPSSSEQPPLPHLNWDKKTNNNNLKRLKKVDSTLVTDCDSSFKLDDVEAYSFQENLSQTREQFSRATLDYLIKYNL
jgi:hypothetical protein